MPGGGPTIGGPGHGKAPFPSGGPPGAPPGPCGGKLAAGGRPGSPPGGPGMGPGIPAGPSRLLPETFIIDVSVGIHCPGESGCVGGISPGPGPGAPGLCAGAAAELQQPGCCMNGGGIGAVGVAPPGVML
mmetsp:Transcript_79125/g.137166  ORF Transcript_79125/g.137166 Transcript_79125/m.137166 type:complete len:130 (-) Transcript_79125:463-852(-)